MVGSFWTESMNLSPFRHFQAAFRQDLADPYEKNMDHLRIAPRTSRSPNAAPLADFLTCALLRRSCNSLKPRQLSAVPVQPAWRLRTGICRLNHDKNSSKVEKEVFQGSHFLEICSGIIGWLINSSISQSYDRNAIQSCTSAMKFQIG